MTRTPPLPPTSRCPASQPKVNAGQCPGAGKRGTPGKLHYAGPPRASGSSVPEDRRGWWEKGGCPSGPREITLKTPWRGGTLAHCCCVCWRRPTVGVSEREAVEGALLSAGRSHGCSLKPERGAKCVRTTHKLLSTFSCLFLKAHGKAPERADAPGQSRCARGRPWPLRKPGRTSLPLYSRSGVWPPGGGH